MADEPRRRWDVRIEQLTTLFVWGVALLLFLYFMDEAKLLLLGALAAATLTATLRPLLRKAPGPHNLKAVLIGLLPIILIACLLFLISWRLSGPIHQLNQQIRQWPQEEQKINQLLMQWSTRLGLNQPIQLQDVLAQFGDFLTGVGGRKLVISATGFISGLTVALAFVFMGSIYLLIARPGELTDPLLRALPPIRRVQATQALEDLEPRLRGWLIGTLIGSLTLGVASGIGYVLIGISLALPLALLTGLAEIIPTIGPILAFLVALLFAATQGGGKMIGVGVVYLIIQAVESHILIPLVMKKAVHIPPVVTLFTIILWGSIFGLPGLILAIPLNLLIWSFVDHLVLRPRAQEYEK